MSTFLDTALGYLKRGWSVVPAHSIDAEGVCTCTRTNCTSAGKHPRIQWAQFQQERPSEAQVNQWWQRWPEANVVIVTGRVSGLVVLDIDPRHGGQDSLADLQPLPETVTCLTGGGGEHLYYAHPGAGQTIPNGANLLPGIDLRGDGGYVIAAPSKHASGRYYQWEGGYSPDECTPAPMPPSVHRLLTGYRPGLDVASKGETSEIDINGMLTGRVKVAEGERNVQMTRIAGHLVARTPNDLDMVLGVMMSVNLMAFEPSLEFSEVQAIMRSIASRHERRQEAVRQIEERVTNERASLMGNADRLELARALWSQIGVPDVVDWLRVVSAEGVEYQVELPDRVAILGGNLLGGFGHIRDALLNASGHVIPKFKSGEWDKFAEQLARLAREEQVGPLRQEDQVREWLDEYRKRAHDFPEEARADGLRGGPIYYNGRIATKGPKLLGFLETQFGERYTPTTLGKRLRRAGWEYTAIRAGDGFTKVWLSPPLGGDTAA